MSDLPLPPDDPQRISALRALGLLDTPPEERFDRISRVAARLFGAPVAFISLLDAHRQWFKSCIGLGFSETPIAISFCAHALTGEPLLVPDAAADPRFRDNPYVVESPFLRAYAGHPLSSPAGQVVGTLCVMDFVPRTWEPHDLAALADLAKWAETEISSSDLARLAHELQESEGRLRAIMGSAGEGIVVMGQNGETQFINTAAERIVGHPPGGLIGADFHAAVHHSRPDGEPYPFADCGVSTTLREGRTLSSVPEVYWRQDGTPVPIEMSCAPLLDDGQPTGAVLVFRDVSERRELEQMKDQFVSSVSHELRTPLTAIKGYLEGVLEEEVGPLTEDQRSDLEIVARNVDRLHALIDDLLLLSRMEARRADFGRRPVDLRQLVVELVDDLRPAAAKRGQRFSVDLPDEMVVQGDDQRLRQAFANILSNALKFNRPKGRVSVRGADDAEHFVVAVSDEGVGIPAAELERLSQRFFRASTAGTIEGTGLGLAITREIVERHHGRLEIESTEGEGSTFTIRLPRQA